MQEMPHPEGPDAAPQCKMPAGAVASCITGEQLPAAARAEAAVRPDGVFYGHHAVGSELFDASGNFRK